MQSLHWHSASDSPNELPFEMHAPTHRSRLALERVLADPRDEPAWAALAETYDQMAAQWTEWAQSQHWYNAPIRAGLSHAKPVALALEVGCGTGQATAPLTGFTSRIVATDINFSMVSLAPRLPEVRYVVSDVRRLPVRTGSVPLLVGLNAIPHVAEFDRVIAADGQLLWCTSFAAGTPLYVDPERLLRLFGPGWQGEAGHAGHGDWMLLNRNA
jgi:SAM-dependent methyltransferase